LNRTRMHVEAIRRLDPVTLEISVAEPLRRPLVQLSAETIAGMMALPDAEVLPKALRKQLAGFADRMVQEIIDLPDIAFEELLRDLQALEPAHVPMSLRNAVAAEIEMRPELTKAKIRDLLGLWENVQPQPVQLGSGRPVILRAKTAAAPEEPVRRPRPAGGTSPRTHTEAAPKAVRQAPVKLVDEERRRWVVDQLLERLAEYMEQGLREDVLVAGVRHRARADYPDMTPVEIVGVLRELGNAGRVRHSAGRWKRVLSGW
jgi:hypothetical protein